jgi:hypothetical protein
MLIAERSLRLHFLNYLLGYCMVIEQSNTKWEPVNSDEAQRMYVQRLKVDTGYIYHIRRFTIVTDVGGHTREYAEYEQFIHGSADHTIGQTENDSTRSVEKETSGDEVSRIRRSAKRKRR